MINGKFNVIIDQAWGSSGKGKTSTFLADKYGITKVSSSNFPNAGHTAAFRDPPVKFVAKAIPTASILKKFKGTSIDCFLSPGSGFSPKQLIKEWVEAGKPKIFIHSRASLVTDDHAARERDGGDSTKHIASTMQGSGVAIADKILRKADVALVGNQLDLKKYLDFYSATDPEINKMLDNGGNPLHHEFLDKVQAVDAMDFRNMTHSMIHAGNAWLHEGSQGYALSIDHGSHYPFCTSRNCTLQSAMDQMAIPPSMIGDVYLNLRTFPIRVGNVVEDGIQKGYSGDFYPDCEELTWEQVAAESGMPPAEAKILAERERTTVTKRIRRVSTFSFLGLKDAVRVNGVTKLVLNFIQYIDWRDAGLKGNDKNVLSNKSRAFIDKIEDVAGVPVVLIGTGALHDEMIDLLGT